MNPGYISKKTLESLSARESLNKRSPICVYVIMSVSTVVLLCCTIVLGAFMVSTQNEAHDLMFRCSRIGSLQNFFSVVKRDTYLVVNCQVSPESCSETNRTTLTNSHDQVYRTIYEMSPSIAEKVRSICFLPIEALLIANTTTPLSERLLSFSIVTKHCSEFLERSHNIRAAHYSDQANAHRVKSDRTLWVTFSSFCGVIVCSLITMVWIVNKLLYNSNVDIQKYQEHMRRMLKSWNHDNKNVAGALLSGLEELEQGSIEKDPTLLESLHQCQALSSHVAHSVSVMTVRHAIATGTTDALCTHRQQVNILSIVTDILRIPGFADFALVSSEKTHSAYTVPAICYHVIYQVLRNAYVHGSAPRTVEVSDGIFTCRNGPSPHHQYLLGLPNDTERLKRCLGGVTGSKTSSGIGLRDTFDLCLVEDIQVAFRFLDDGVEMVCDFRRARSPPMEAADGNGQDEVKVEIESTIYPSKVPLESDYSDSLVKTVPEPASIKEISEGPGCCTVSLPPYKLGVRYRVCTVDDFSATRVQTRTLVAKLNGIQDIKKEIVFDSSNHVRHPWILTLGHKPITVDACVAEVNTWIDWCTPSDPDAYSIILLDQNIEFPGQASILGTDILKHLTSRPNVFPMIRSGNDSPDDISIYKENGALNIVPKHLKLGDIVQRILDTVDSVTSS